jgi:hypothetical protein
MLLPFEVVVVVVEKAAVEAAEHEFDIVRRDAA